MNNSVLMNISHCRVQWEVFRYGNIPRAHIKAGGVAYFWNSSCLCDETMFKALGIFSSNSFSFCFSCRIWQGQTQQVEAIDLIFLVIKKQKQQPKHVQVPLAAVSHILQHTGQCGCPGWRRYSWPGRDRNAHVSIVKETVLSVEGKKIILKYVKTNKQKNFPNGILTEVLISLARLAYFNVLRVSSYILDEGLTLAIITVLQLPPKESLRIRVSLLSLYGIKVFFFWNQREKTLTWTARTTPPPQKK